jgi:hypothetical protein
MLVGRTTRRPQGVLQPFGQSHEALAAQDHMSGRLIDVTPRFVLVPPELESNRPIGTACQMLPLWAKTRA